MTRRGEVSGMTGRISTIVEESIALKREFFRRSLVEVRRAVQMVVGTLKGGGKLLIFGNGGSAADAQHIAAEFVNKFMMKRDALPAIALTTDTSVLTSVANDTDFSQVFSRQIEALGQEGDLAWGITTSGRSPNVVQGLIRAKQLGLKTLVLTGSDGGEVQGGGPFPPGTLPEHAEGPGGSHHDRAHHL